MASPLKPTNQKHDQSGGFETTTRRTQARAVSVERRGIKKRGFAREKRTPKITPDPVHFLGKNEVEKMGRRGPVPDPNGRWTREGKNARQPAPELDARGRPIPVRMPESIRGIEDACIFWRQRAPALVKAGRLRPEHAETFGMLARFWADAQRLEALVAAEGDIIAGPRGPMTNPAVYLLRSARKDFQKLAVEFGLTPMSSARIPTDKAKPKATNPLAAFGIVGVEETA